MNFYSKNEHPTVGERAIYLWWVLRSRQAKFSLKDCSAPYIIVRDMVNSQLRLPSAIDELTGARRVNF